MRKKPEKKHQNLERWIISYADFTTLLLATFVVMYAVSSINSSKFQEMAEAFSTAFIGKITTLQASGMAAGHKAPFNFMPSPVHTPVITRDPQVKNLPPALRQAIEQRAQELTKAYDELMQLLGGMIERGQVRVTLQSLGVVIDINAIILFRSGKADLTPDAAVLVDRVAGIIKGLHYPIQVNGFTDTQPIHSEQFETNWDLSAARAMAVVKRFASAGVDPTLLVGAGYGEFHPAVPNDTPENMARNRRVSIVVVSPLENGRTGDVTLLQSPEPGADAATPTSRITPLSPVPEPSPR